MLTLPALAVSAEERDDTVYVSVDRAKVFRIDEEASTIIVGNPLIADVSIQDRTTLVVTGKAYGSTNLIILDEKNEPIIDELIVVQYAEDNTVTVTRSSTRETYSCTPICNPTLRTGDSKDFFGDLQGQTSGLAELSAAAAGMAPSKAN
ncbi:pilus assembly protein N-terminal domain-containing protein [Roseibium aestuarii]|uniref:Pilus assembly protein N-terminal domain-containing protein n=1 Tax=Roseibium aestuarii TaxID=2600299 RepID=A0ABW4JVA8_9HYPH|nr:pilus assembly protein N-terminal domain-containing protein [Roseibium aestuarii]